MFILKDDKLIHGVKKFCLSKQDIQACAVILVPSFLLVFVVGNKAYSKHACFDHCELSLSKFCLKFLIFYLHFSAVLCLDYLVLELIVLGKVF